MKNPGYKKQLTIAKRLETRAKNQMKKAAELKDERKYKESQKLVQSAKINAQQASKIRESAQRRVAGIRKAERTRSEKLKAKANALISESFKVDSPTEHKRMVEEANKMRREAEKRMAKAIEMEDILGKPAIESGPTIDTAIIDTILHIATQGYKYAPLATPRARGIRAWVNSALKRYDRATVARVCQGVMDKYPDLFKDELYESDGQGPEALSSLYFEPQSYFEEELERVVGEHESIQEKYEKFGTDSLSEIGTPWE